MPSVLNSGSDTEDVHQDSARYSVPLKLNFSLAPRFDSLIADVTTEVHGFRGIRERRDAREGTTKAVSIVLANILRAHQRDPRLYVALSLSSNSYKLGPFNRLSVGHAAIERVVDYLSSTEPPLIDLRPGGQFRDPSGRTTHSYWTRMRATPLLADRLSAVGSQGPAEHSHPLAASSAPEADSHAPSLAALFVEHDLPVIRLKNQAGNFVAFDDNRETVRMRESLHRFNAFLQLHWIDLLLPDDAFRSVANGSIEEESDGDAFGEGANADTRRVDLLFQRSLYRVFNNSTFNDGGRFYGGWWQNIPSRFRHFVTINWAPTRELDYSNMQAAMLYAMSGRQLEGDAYAIDGIEHSAANRALIKRTFFKLINATGRIRAPRRDQLPPGWTWTQLMEAVRGKHETIAPYFGTGIGIRLQRIDSDIAGDVMQAMMLRNILVLPIHDSFITYRAQYAVVETEMKRAYGDRMRSGIAVDVDPSFADTILGGVPINPDDEDDEFVIDAWEAMESDPRYRGYFSRKRDFLERQSDEWRWRFMPA